MGWVRLIEWDRCPPDRGTYLECFGRELAVFRLDNPPRASVLDNACPHSGGNLAGGSVDGAVVRCPWHDWPFDLDTGQCIHSEKASAVRYPSEVRDGYVWADLPAIRDDQPTLGPERPHRPGV
ncbi:MAG: Rieske 2Fe-2S domain-containing protein [Planctomycetes bacterium]|nr:Rieske 2Fe-2S domain-containing protein [Planctomycetota bacterium]